MHSSFGRPQMWERVQVGFGSTGKKRKGPCAKQCAWRKHGSLRHTPGGSMPSQTLKHCKIQSRKDAPKMANLEAPCAQNAPGRSTMRLPEALLPRNPTWESSHFWGLTTARTCYIHKYSCLQVMSEKLHFYYKDVSFSRETPKLTPKRAEYGSESTVSNTELCESFLSLTELQAEKLTELPLSLSSCAKTNPPRFSST